MNLSLKYLLFVVLLLLSFQLQAQVQFSIAVEVKEIGRKDELQVDYVISGSNNVINFQPPVFKTWNLLAGPRIMSESYNVNGKTTSLTKYIYFLSPKSAGKLTLPSTSVEVNNKTFFCSEVEINVKKQDHVDGVPAPGKTNSLGFQADANTDNSGSDYEKDHMLKPGEDVARKIRDNLFIKVLLSKKKVFVGEPILAEYRLYTRLKSVSRVTKQPSFNGCSVHEMTTDNDGQTEQLNGKQFNSYLIRKVQLTPLQTGTVVIGQVSVENDITFVSSTADYRSLFYGEPAGTVQTVTLKSDPVSVEVIALPQEASNYPIGNFKISSKLKSKSIAVNEPNALIVTIEGSGNFKPVIEPDIKWPAGVYGYDAIETDEMDKLSFPLTGKKIFEIPFEAGTAGEINIPSVSFRFFDPSRGKVQTVETAPLHLSVEPAVNKSLKQSVAAVTNSGFSINWLLYLIPVLFATGAFFIWRKPKSNTTPVLSTTPITEVVTRKGTFNVHQRFENLLLVQGDAEFFVAARTFSTEAIESGVGNKAALQQVITDCNTMLYTPLPTTSKKEILATLQYAIA